MLDGWSIYPAYLKKECGDLNEVASDNDDEDDDDDAISKDV